MSFHDELTAAFGPEPVGANGATVAAAPGGLLRAVFRGLSDGGVKVQSLSQWIAIATLVIELVQTVGPQVGEIVRLVRERLGI